MRSSNVSFDAPLSVSFGMPQATSLHLKRYTLVLQKKNTSTSSEKFLMI